MKLGGLAVHSRRRVWRANISPRPLHSIRAVMEVVAVAYTRLIALRKAPTSSQNLSFVAFFRCGRVLIANKRRRSLVPISSWAQPPIFVLLAMLSGSSPRRSRLVVISALIPTAINSSKTILLNSRSCPPIVSPRRVPRRPQIRRSGGRSQIRLLPIPRQ
jgi:hypothetical protein